MLYVLLCFCSCSVVLWPYVLYSTYFSTYLIVNQEIYIYILHEPSFVAAVEAAFKYISPLSH